MKNLRLCLTFIFLIAFSTANLFSAEYIILGWNDLGMHCANKNFSAFAILPPYNNLNAQVIKVGNENTMPKLITTDVTVQYSIPGNTYSVGKTDFWTYANTLFGVTLADNIGLKGNGLSGNMTVVTDRFNVEGVPLTPYPDDDLVKEHPYQLGLFKLLDLSNNILATTQNVVPVSNEISCVSSGCHSSEKGIVNSHESVHNLDKTKPVLCAQCHADNALGKPGNGSVASLSYIIHNKHKNRTSDCYKCHPGKNTQCFRDIMFSKGKVCTDCHGTIANVASTIQSGRRPWLDEPKCATSGCHLTRYAEETGKLFRESKGHGGLYCSACHGSPHAITPTVIDGDNAQNLALQGFAGPLKDCKVCHGVNPTGKGPHGLTAVDVQNPELSYNAFNLNPNPVVGNAKIYLNIAQPAEISIELVNILGINVNTIASNQFYFAGQYTFSTDLSNLADGMYYLVMKYNNKTKIEKVIVRH